MNEEEESDAIRAGIVREILEFIEDAGPIDFDLAGPCKITKKVGPKFVKAAFIGDETLQLINSYEGKKDVILVFSDLRGVHEYEIPLSQAPGLLSHFKNFVVAIEEKCAEKEALYLNEQRAKLHNEQLEQERNADERYGSW